MTDKTNSDEKMKVFVWEGVCSGGMMIAIAPNIGEARIALLKKYNYISTFDLLRQPQEFDLSESAEFMCWGGG